MPTRLRKSRRYRGSRQCGWGQVGQHRASGARGGFGRAGLMKHKWTWTVKYDPDHFGHNGFKPLGHRTLPRWINVGELDDLAQRLQKPAEGRLELNLSQLGYARLLGEGRVEGAYGVVVSSCTSSAREKVEKAGGEVLGSKP